MSVKLTHAAEILAYYAAGYFPLYDLDDRFYWERLPIRAVIPVTDQNVARARSMARRPRKKYDLRRSTAFEEVIAALQDPAVAYDRKTNQLAGALLGIALPGTFIAETMFGLQPDASKLCLCQLLLDAQTAGFRLIDVQTPHNLDDLPPFGLPLAFTGKTPHPAIRLGEQTITLPHFLKLFKTAAAVTFPGTLSHWLIIASALSFAARKPDQAPTLLARLNPEQLAAARPMLQPEFAP
jgi:hypothetical protein